MATNDFVRSVSSYLSGHPDVQNELDTLAHGRKRLEAIVAAGREAGFMFSAAEAEAEALLPPPIQVINGTAGEHGLRWSSSVPHSLPQPVLRAIGATMNDLPIGGNENDLVLEPGQDLVLRDTNGFERLRLDAATGTIRIRNGNGLTRILVDPDGGNIFVGGSGQDGDLLPFPSSADSFETADSTIHVNADGRSIGVGTPQRPGWFASGGMPSRLTWSASAATSSFRDILTFAPTTASCASGSATMGRSSLVARDAQGWSTSATIAARRSSASISAARKRAAGGVGTE